MAARPPLRSLLSTPVRWLLLVALTAALVTPLVLVGLPAAVMLGAMVSAILLRMVDAGPVLPRQARLPAEALLGGQLAMAITPATIDTVRGQTVLFLAVGLVIIAIGTAISAWLQSRRTLPGSTAIWGLSPGAAPVMMLMASEFGADGRLVAFMQYLRVLLVAVVAPLVAHVWGGFHGATALPVATQAAAIDWPALGLTLVVLGAGLGLALVLRFGGATVLIPLVLGGVLHAAGLVQIVLPAPLMSAAYITIGWSVGQSFTPAVLRHARATLPQILSSILVMILICGLVGLAVARIEGIDMLSAYLATSPGGLSSVAIIAATSPVDLAFVAAMQSVRLILVMTLAPPIARYLTVRLGNGGPAGHG